jgi:hypothetical protein
MRRATPDDTPAMALAHVDSIRSLGPAFYAADLVDGWAAAVSPDMYVRAMAAGEVFFIAVAPLDGHSGVLGFSSHVPAGGEQGARAITLEASLPGIGFYRTHGFVEIEPCEVRLRSGVSMPCVLMRKELAGTTAG